MCDPVTMAVASFGIQAVSTYSAYQSEKAQYQVEAQQADEQNRYYERNKREAIKSQIEQSAQTGNRLRQEDKGRAEESMQIDQQATADRATALMTAGENGVSGLSVSGLISEFYAKQGTAKAQIATEGKMAHQQANVDLKGIEAQAEDRIRSVRKATKPIKPSRLSAVLGIAGAGLGSYNGYKEAIKNNQGGR